MESMMENNAPTLPEQGNEAEPQSPLREAFTALERMAEERRREEAEQEREYQRLLAENAYLRSLPLMFSGDDTESLYQQLKALREEIAELSQRVEQLEQEEE
jgi:hypothetical protein